MFTSVILNFLEHILSDYNFFKAFNSFFFFPLHHFYGSEIPKQEGLG